MCGPLLWLLQAGLGSPAAWGAAGPVRSPMRTRSSSSWLLPGLRRKPCFRGRGPDVWGWSHLQCPPVGGECRLKGQGKQCDVRGTLVAGSLARQTPSLQPWHLDEPSQSGPPGESSAPQGTRLTSPPACYFSERGSCAPGLGVGTGDLGACSRRGLSRWDGPA